MQKLPWQRPWICSRCLRAQRRYQSTGSTYAAVTNATPLPSLPDGLSTQDNKTIRDIFDNKDAWTDFSSRAKSIAGLIGNKYLTKPKGFQRFADVSLAKCRQLVDKTLAAKSSDDYRAIPKDLDRLSDLLCRVIDLSEFIRTIHADQIYSNAATESHARMFQYMNELNTMTGLNEQLKKAFSMPDVVSLWTEEEKAAGQILVKDFAKSGIHLPARQRREFVEISNDINQVGTRFMNGMELARDYVTLEVDELQGVDPVLVRNLRHGNKVSVMLQSPASRVIMSTAHSDSARRKIYVAERTASRQTITLLETLILKRARLAKLTGFSSFADMTLADKMAKNPEAVHKFLLSLSESNRGQSRSELQRFLDVKRTLSTDAANVKPWDHASLFNRALTHQSKGLPIAGRSRSAEQVKNYFSIGHVMQGLSSLFHHLYGVRLIPRETKIGEVWHPDVRRLDVYNDKQEHLATVYCDLFARAGKLPNPAHFTLVCSREIDETEVQESQERDEPLNDGMPVGLMENAFTGKISACQLPVIALVCDFQSSSTQAPALLSSHSLITLFHEMGHAIHSILGRTSMQGIAGTRCVTDFAELPSILMEYFAMDPEVLTLFARHWKTGAPMPPEMAAEMVKEKQARATLNAGWDNQTQILMALEDQAYHSEEAVAALASDHYDSSAVFHRIWDTYGMVKEPHETSQQGFFGHLYGYGATYYAYLFDRAIARQVWRAVFRDGAHAGGIDREAGERFKTEVLRWGGGRDPWRCLEGLMGEGKGVLGDGGELAMREVGQWGVGAGAEGAL